MNGHSGYARSDIKIDTMIAISLRIFALVVIAIFLCRVPASARHDDGDETTRFHVVYLIDADVDQHRASVVTLAVRGHNFRHPTVCETLLKSAAQTQLPLSSALVEAVSDLAKIDGDHVVIEDREQELVRSAPRAHMRQLASTMGLALKVSVSTDVGFSTWGKVKELFR